MAEAQEEDLVYFSSIDELTSKGYICIGVLFEVRGVALSNHEGSSLYTQAKVKQDSSLIGHTFATVNNVKSWINNIDFSWLNQEMKYDSSTGTTTVTLNQEYPATDYYVRTNEYIKTEYDENGQIISGTNVVGYTGGNSIFISGATQSISINTIDEDTRETKINYNIGKNEYEALYQISPKITPNNGNVVAIKDVAISIDAILPKGLTYVKGSSNYGEPEVVENENGTSSLRWYKYNCTVGEPIEPVLFKVHINEETANGKQYEVKTIMSEVIEEGQDSKIGNSRVSDRTAKTSINIINLSSYSLYKTTETPVIELNGEIHFKITAINKTDEPIKDFQLLDILPYNGDNRGTNFNGTYTVSKIDLKQTSTSTNSPIDASKLKLYTTENEAVRSGVTAKNEDLGISPIWSLGESGNKIGKIISAYCVIGEVEAKAKVEVDIYVQTIGNKPNDTYKNSASAQTNKETEEIKTPIVIVQNIKRKIQGKVWQDANKDGLITKGEKNLQGIRVSIVNADGTPAIDINGREIASTVTDANGEYTFQDMVRGKYKIKVEVPEKTQEITKKEVGINVEINSKFNPNGITDEISSLNNIDMPIIVEKNVNAGIAYKDSQVNVKHLEEGTNKQISKEVIIKGQVTDKYQTQKATDIPLNYELVAEPTNKNGIMTIEPIEVIYYYRLKTPEIEATITKESSRDKITKITQKIPYTITYEATIDKYIGNGSVTITDKLPYAIDASKSQLNGGTYDEESKTITWTENLTGIDTFANGKNKIEIIKQIELTYKNIDVTKATITNEVEGKVNLETPKKTETVTGKEEIPTQYVIDIKVNKVWEDQENKYSKRPDEIIVIVKEGSKEVKRANMNKENNWQYTFAKLPQYNEMGEEIIYIVDEQEVSEDDLFHYTKQIGNLTNTPTNEDQKEITITNKMTKIPGYVNVKYVDKNTGEEINDMVEKEGVVGEDFDVTENKKEITGYTLVEEPQEKTGTYTDETQEKVYYYAKNTRVIVKYLEKDNTPEDDTDNVVLTEEPQYEIEGYEGKDYETEEKEIQYYKFVESTNNTKGTMTDEEITIIYYYQKRTFNLSVDKWLSSVNMNGITADAKNYNTRTELYKMEVQKKKIATADIKFTYKIRISNTGEIEGTVGKVTEIIPQGFSFKQEDNQLQWKEKNGILTTDILKTEVIKPNEYKEIEIVLSWNKGEENFGSKNNIVMINNLSNPAGFEDINEEDDSSKCEVLLGITTGLDRNDKIIIIGMINILIVVTIVLLVCYKKKEK